MSFSISLLLDIIRDRLARPIDRPFIIITKDQLAMKVYSKIPAFHIYTTALRICDEFGARDNSARGFLTHGRTKIKVRRPYPGQYLFAWIFERQESVFSRRQVSHIYEKPVTELLDDPWDHLRNLYGLLGPFDQKVLQVTVLGNENSHDEFLKLLLYVAVFSITDGSMTLPAEKTEHLWELAKEQYGIDIMDLFSAGLIYENKEDGIVISDALFFLYMHGMHRIWPMSTVLDKQGIIQMAD